MAKWAIAEALPADFDFPMSKQSRARAAASAKAAPEGGQASAVSGAASLPVPNAFLVRWGVVLAGSILVLAVMAVYYNSFSGPLILDDSLAITTNPSIKHFSSALSPPASSTTDGRPVLNLTFALNYAMGGLNVWGYHALNLLIHALAGLTLFGIVRRTLRERPTSNIQHPTSKANHLLHGLSPAEARSLALAVAVIWAVHPLQTEAVTYISERAESLMGLFYLLTLYCFVRYTDETGERREARGERPEKKTRDPKVIRPPASGLWSLASILSCLLGAMTKQIIVTAPVVMLLYDRTFVAGSFREAWRLRWRYYLGLACTWLPLAWLMTGLKQHGIGFDQKVTWWSYALTSCRSVVLYLKLAFWPHPLIFDYGTHVVQNVTEIVPCVLVLVALLAAMLIALWCRPVLGFVGACFFVILAPVSSVIPVAGQPMAEHRMYLPLAAVVAWVVVGLYRLIGRRSLLVFAAAALGLGWFSVQRNQDYRSEVTIWSDTSDKCPDNERAFYNLGCALDKRPDRKPEAIAAYEAALRIRPAFVEAQTNLGNALLNLPGRLPEAMAAYGAALQLKPDSAEAHYNLGNALLKMPGRLPDAMAEFEAALRINPDYAEAHNNLGDALRAVPGRLLDAIDQFEAALRINPGLVDAQISLGNALLKVPGRRPDAMVHFEAAVRLDPDSALAHYDLGNAFALSGLWPDAITQYEAALRINPGSVEAHYNLGNTLLKMPGRLPDAIAQYEEALRLKPDLAPAREMLERLQSPTSNVQH